MLQTPLHQVRGTDYIQGESGTGNHFTLMSPRLRRCLSAQLDRAGSCLMLVHWHLTGILVSAEAWLVLV